MSKLSALAGKGQEQIQDTKTDYLKIAQTISEETIKQKPNYIPGLEAGMFFCPTTKKVYGNVMDVIVLSTRKNYMITDMKDEFKGFADRIDPTWERDADGRLRTPEGYFAKVQYSYLIVTPDNLEQPIVLVLKKTDVPAARDWNTQIKNCKLEDGSPAPIFGAIWTLTSTFREGDKGSWFSLCNGKSASVAFKGFIDDAIVDDVASLYDATANRLALTAPQAEETKALPTSAEEAF